MSSYLSVECCKADGTTPLGLGGSAEKQEDTESASVTCDRQLQRCDDRRGTYKDFAVFTWWEEAIKNRIIVKRSKCYGEGLETQSNSQSSRRLSIASSLSLSLHFALPLSVSPSLCLSLSLTNTHTQLLNRHLDHRGSWSWATDCQCVHVCACVQPENWPPLSQLPSHRQWNNFSSLSDFDGGVWMWHCCRLGF